MEGHDRFERSDDKPGTDIRQYTNYVHSIAKRYKRANVEHDDLFQEGVIGLIQAKANYKPERAGFLTYAHSYIWRNIRRVALNRTIVEVPTWLRDKKGFKPYAHVSLDQPATTDSDVTRLDLLRAPLANIDMRVDAEKALSLLAATERLIVEDYIHGRTFVESAKTLKVTRQRVEQIFTRAIYRLRLAMANPGRERSEASSRVCEYAKRRPKSGRKILRGTSEQR